MTHTTVAEGGPNLRDTLAFVRAAYARAGTDGVRRLLNGLAVMNLLPKVLPGITVSHAERQVALLRDVFRTTKETEGSLLDAGFAAEVVESVNRLTRFDAGFTYLEHISVVAASNDLAAKRVLMAALIREEQMAANSPEQDTPERRERRNKALELVRRGLGYGA